MSPRLGIQLKRFPIHPRALLIQSRQQRKHASTAAAAATTRINPGPPPSIEQLSVPIPQISSLYPPTQPPSLKRPEFRKSQLHRQYTSLLRCTPLMLLFQHNNLKATEWMVIRRELYQALRKCDDETLGGGHHRLAETIKIHTVQTGIFAAALRVVEYFHPEEQPQPQQQTSSSSSSSAPHTHGLSRAAYEAVADKKLAHALTPLLSGPLAVLTFPTVSPQHLKAALSIMAPSPPLFAAPRRRANPGYYEPAVQSGLQKLLLLGARIEGRVFDTEGARLVGTIEGGMDGLRAQLVAMLQSMAVGVTGALESAGRSLFFTVEGRRSMLEEEERGKKGGSGDAGGGGS